MASSVQACNLTARPSKDTETPTLAAGEVLPVVTFTSWTSSLSTFASGQGLIPFMRYLVSLVRVCVIRPQCSDAHMWEILEMTGLKDAVAGLPLGLLSPVSEHGSNWSAGQRQLLCISRAMVNQPGVLVFDEATASV